VSYNKTFDHFCIIPFLFFGIWMSGRLRKRIPFPSWSHPHLFPSLSSLLSLSLSLSLILILSLWLRFVYLLKHHPRSVLLFIFFHILVLSLLFDLPCCFIISAYTCSFHNKSQTTLMTSKSYGTYIKIYIYSTSSS